MQDAIAIQLDMPKPVAEALLSSLRIELRRALSEHWYDDRYRQVPELLRSRRIFDDYPALAAMLFTLAAQPPGLPGSGSLKSSPSWALMAWDGER